MPERHRKSRQRSVVRHTRSVQGRPVLRAFGLVLTAVLAFGASAAASVALRLQSNVDTIDLDGLVVAASPSVTREPDPDDPNAGSPVNILLIGSDQRTGENEAIGGASPGMASDTTIVAHISADRTRVELVSIPRDSMVRMPSCTATNGKTSRTSSKAQFNSAFATGWSLGGDIASAAACTMSAVQENTGLTLDHVAVVDMAGFQQMIDAIGGVDICIPEAMQDSYTGLDVVAGNQHLDGVTALQFARARHVVGSDGSDLTRIGNQQRLLSAVMTEVLSKNIVADVPELLSFLSAATSSLTTDGGLTVQTMVGLAYSARSLSGSGITFMTVPNAADPEDRNRVVWTSAADTVWSNMVQDLPVVAAETTTTPATAPSSAATTGATTPATASEPAVAPAPAETKTAGREPFTGDDVTAVCG